MDIIYINYDLNPGLDTYSLSFLLQNGLTRENQPIVKMDGFKDLPFNPNTWTAFAISCDYRKGQATLFL